ncbi:MAG: hypothetical protein IJT73_04450, partial [Selenomonadaceae bacterium]|nr:hypothetical protein [Selenomonadaceae bacterium]
NGSLAITDIVKGTSAHISNGSGGLYELNYNGSNYDLMNDAGLVSDLGYDSGVGINNTSITEPTGDATANENSGGGSSSSSSSYKSGNPLVIHIGSNAGQTLSFYLNDMHTNSLKGKVPNETDAEYLAELQFDMDKYNAYAELLGKVQTLTLDDINLRTRENANIAIRLVDSALDYALGEATNIGAYLQRLEYTEENITTATENTQAAESTIRDADMAREMSNYAKANVLSQAAQAVLSQANQDSGRVLGLLQ